MRKFVLIAICMALAVTACKQSGPGGAASKGKPVAKINDVTITAEDLKREYSYLQPELREIFIEEGGMKALLDEVVKKEILYQEATKLGIQDSSEFKTRIEDYKKRLLIELLLNKEIINSTQISDKDVREFYDKNLENFVIESPDGKKSRTIEFEKVSSLIRERLLAEKQKESFEKYIEGMQKTYKVEIDSAEVEKLSSSVPGTKEISPAISNAPEAATESGPPAKTGSPVEVPQKSSAGK